MERKKFSARLCVKKQFPLGSYAEVHKHTDTRTHTQYAHLDKGKLLCMQAGRLYENKVGNKRKDIFMSLKNNGQSDLVVFVLCHNYSYSCFFFMFISDLTANKFKK